jgi:hypothetical protein
LGLNTNNQEIRGIESGLADYYPGSFNNDALVAEIAAKRIANKPYIRNLSNQRTFDEIKLANTEQEAGEIWGGAFWELRQLLGQEIADKYFYTAWVALRQPDVSKETSVGFVKRLLEVDRAAQNGKNVDQIQAVFTRRGLKL